MSTEHYDLDTCKYEELVKFCKEFKINDNGTKTEIADRIWEYLQNNCNDLNINLYRIIGNYIVTID